MGRKRRRTECRDLHPTGRVRGAVKPCRLLAAFVSVGSSSAFVVSHRPSFPRRSPCLYTSSVNNLDTTSSQIWTTSNNDGFLVAEFPNTHPPLGAADLSAFQTELLVPTLVSLIEPQEEPRILHDHQSISPRSRSPLSLWRRRLVTRQDRNHLHKLTGLLFLLSSWGLAGYGVVDLLAHGWTQPVTSHGKPFLGLLLVLWSSSVAQSFSSIRMACHYRKPAIRDTFLCNAAVAILGTVSALWSSAWYPTALNGAPSKAFYLIMDAIGLIGMGDNLWRLRELIASRQTNKGAAAELSGWHYWKDVFVYMMPILIGAPFFVAIGWQFGIRHDRTFYLNLLQSQRYPHLQAGAVYGMVMVAMGASYSSLIVTLRDKKLIEKRTEGLSLTAVMLCLIGSLYQALRDPGAIAALVGM